MPPVAAMPQRAAACEFTVSDWKEVVKNTLRGFCSITMPSGLILRNCSLHEKEGSRWIGLPAQQFKKDDGTSCYKPIVEFTNKQARDRFNEAAFRAVDWYLAEGGR